MNRIASLVLGVVSISLSALALPGCGGGGGGTSRPPQPPGVVIARSPDSGEVWITWTLVSRATSYNLYWSTSPGVTKATGTQIVGVNAPYTHSGLTDGTTYYYVVTAQRGKREGVESAEVSALPLASPTGVTATSQNSGEAAVNWNAVTGASSYNIYWDTMPGVTKATGNLIIGASAPYLHTGLSDGTTYYYVVTARNTVGGGAESSESTEQCSLPLAPPTGVTITGTSTQATLDWIPSPGSACCNIYWDTSPGVTKASGTPIPCVTPPYTMTGLTGGTSYYFILTCMSGACGGTESSPSAEVCAQPLPPPSSVTAIASGGRITVDWTPVPAATSYNLYWDTNPGVTKTTGTRVQGVTAPYPLTGLVNGTTYYIVVTAVGATCGGAESDESMEVCGLPLAPPTGISVTATTTEATIDWTPSAGATCCNIYWSTTPGVTKLTGIPIPCVTPPYVLAGLTPGTSYYLVLSCTAPVCGGTESVESFELVTQPIDAPSGVTATPGDMQVTVDWTPVPGAATYNIYWSTGPGVTKATGTQIPGVTRPYIHSGLVNWTGHYYVVTAVNTIGGGAESVESAEAGATPGLAGGDLDTSFGGQGWVTHDNAAGGSGLDWGLAITVDASGRILVAGSSENVAGDWDMAIWRFDAGGGLDPTFNGQGWVTHDNAAGGSASDLGYGITTDASGRILVTGYSVNLAGDQDMVIWAYDPTGTPDGAFGTGGVVVHGNAAGGGGDDAGNALVLDPSGRIIVTGRSLNASGDLDMVIWAYDSTGTLDPAFGSGGIAVHDSAAGGNDHDVGEAIAIDGSGRILVAGNSTGVPTLMDLAVWRYDSTGTLDATFGAGGFVVHDGAVGPNSSDWGKGIAVDGSGRILAGGSSDLGDSDMALWAYDSTGTLDASFGTVGVVTHHGAAGGNSNDGSEAITLDASGRILSAGLSQNALGTFDMVIWRHDTTGALDTTFGTGGVAIHGNAAGGDDWDSAEAITLDAAGRILVTGYSSNALGNYDMVIWRLR